MKRAIVAIAPTEAQAHAIVDELRLAGFLAGEISVLFSDRGSDGFGGDRARAGQGAAAGATTGGVLGGALGWLVGIGALTVPGLGAFVVAGPLMAALSGAAVGAAALGITGALVGMGLPEHEAKRYESKVRSGNILVSVHADDPRQRAFARDIFARNGGRDITTTFETKADAPPLSLANGRPSRH